MADHYPIRPITADEYARFRKVGAHAFHVTDDGEERLARVARVFEPERSLAAFDARLPDDEAMVGTTFALSLRMTVPGAAVPAAGVTAVAVLPSHTRRGVLRSLMHRQLADVAARGEEPVAALWAAETPIYARYGYGCASAHASFRFERGEGAMSAAAPADPALRLRLAGPEAARPELAKVFEAVLAVQPGFYARSEDWWDRMLWDAPEDRGRQGQLRCLLAEDDSGTRGYALYTSRSHWDGRTGLPEGTLVIRELQASDPAAAAALWHNLLGRHLVTVVTAEDRSADDPVLHQLAA